MILRSHKWFVAPAIFCLLFNAASPGQAIANEMSIQQDSLSELYKSSVQDIKNKAYKSADTKLRKILKNDSFYQELSGKSAWYQFGKVLELRDKKLEAVAMLEKGFKMLQSVEKRDWYINYDLARMYSTNNLVEKRDRITPLVYDLLKFSRPDNQPVLWERIVNEMVVLFEEPDRTKLNESLETLNEGPGQQLLEFFKNEDPYPHTPENEYLRVFFVRTGIAQNRFKSRTSPRGYDERGEIYVRLGEPSSIISSHSGMQGQLGWELFPYEVWFYNTIHPDLYYTFIRSRGKSQYMRATGPESIIGPFYRGRRTFLNRQNVGDKGVRLRTELYSNLASQHETFRRRLHDMSIQPSAEDALEYALRQFILEDKLHIARIDSLAPLINIDTLD